MQCEQVLSLELDGCKDKEDYKYRHITNSTHTGLKHTHSDLRIGEIIKESRVQEGNIIQFIF